jgi:TolA-binding protein
MRNYFVAAIILAGSGPLPAHAQSTIEGRVDRLEGEMRAVQRKVFPGGSGQYVQPQITAPAPQSDVPGTPAGSPVADLNARVSALESQLSGLTGEIETTQHRVQVIEDSFNAYKRTTDARLKAIEAGGASAGGGPAVGSGPPVGNGAAGADTTDSNDSAPAPASGKPATRPAAGVKPPPAVLTVKDPARAAKIAALQGTKSGDPAEDAYMYGYRLWQAKFYPEAEAQLKSVVATYPKHKRASYAQNLLGRSYLEDGKPSLASIAFYDNYKKMPDGDRAPESLYYLSQALVKLGKPADACKVYGELSDVFAAKITAKMKADIARGRTESKCK